MRPDILKRTLALQERDSAVAAAIVEPEAPPEEQRQYVTPRNRLDAKGEIADGTIAQRAKERVTQARQAQAVTGLGEATGKGLMSGLTQAAGQVGTVMQYVGGKTGIETLEQEGKRTFQYWDNVGKAYLPPEDLKGSILDNPALLGKGAWWAYNVANILPSFALSAVPAAGAARAIKILDTAYMLSPQLITRLARLAPSIVGGVTGGLQEGTSTYQEVLRKGGTQDEAAAAMEMMTLGAGALNALSFGKMFAKAPEGFKSAIKKYLATGAFEAGTEWAEEPVEGTIKKMVGVDTWGDVWQQMKDGVNVVGPAFLVGAAGGAMGGTQDSKNEQADVDRKRAILNELLDQEKEIRRRQQWDFMDKEKAQQEAKTKELPPGDTPDVMQITEDIRLPDEPPAQLPPGPDTKLLPPPEESKPVTTAQPIKESKSVPVEPPAPPKAMQAQETKEPWEMTREELPSTQLTAEDIELKPEQSNKIAKIADMDAVTGKIYAYGLGEKEVYNHADIVQKHGLNPEKIVTGFLDRNGTFIYQYPEEAHKLIVEQALASGRPVPASVLAEYPELAAPAPKPVDAFQRKVDRINEFDFKKLKGRHMQFIQAAQQEAAANGLEIRVDFGKGKAALAEGGKEIKQARTTVAQEAPNAVTMEQLTPDTRKKVQTIVEMLGSDLNVTDLSREQIKSAIQDIKTDAGKEKTVRAQMVIEKLLDDIADGNVGVLTNYGQAGTERIKTGIPIDKIMEAAEEDAPKGQTFEEWEKEVDAIINAPEETPLTDKTGQTVLLEAQKMAPNIPIPVSDYREVAQADASQNTNLFNTQKFEGEKQGEMFGSLRTALRETAKGINEALGGNAPGIRPRYTEENYAKAKPHFQKAWVSYREAGKNLGKLIRDLFRRLGAKFRAFIDRFRKDTEAELQKQEAPDVVKKLTRLVKASKPARKETEALKHEELKRRVAVASSILNKNEGQAAFKMSTGALKGQLPTADFTPPESGLTVRDIDDLFNIIKNHARLRYFEKLNGATALTKLLSGQIPQRAEIKLLEEIFGSELVKEVLAKRSLGERIWEETLEGLSVPRTIQTAFDLSAPLRQGKMLMAGHPVAFMRSFKEMMRALWSEKNAEAIDDAIRRSKYAELRVDAGLYLAPRLGFGTPLEEREEALMNAWAQKIPGVRMSERTYVTFLNKLRADVFDHIASQWEGTEKTMKDYKGLADFINHATGRGDLPKFLARSGPLLNATLYSPRFLLSRLQAPIDVVKGTAASRKVAARDLALFYGTGIMVLSLAALAGADVEIDPRSSDFGKLRIGKTRYDFWAGYTPLVRYIAQVIWNERKSTNTGRISDLNRLETVGRFAQSKLAPTPGAVIDILKGENFMGEDLSAGKLLYERAMPLFVQDMVDAISINGLAGGIATLPAFIGEGVQTYENSPFADVADYKNMLAQQTFGDKWDNLSQKAQRTLRQHHPEIKQKEDKARMETKNPPPLEDIQKEQMSAGRNVTKMLSEDIQKELEAVYLSVGGLSRSIGQGYYLNEARFKQYQELTAKRMNERLKGGTWRQRSEKSKRAFLENAIKDAKEWARNRIK